MNKVNDYFLIVISRYMKKHCTYHWTVFIQSATEMNMSISNFKLNQVLLTVNQMIIFAHIANNQYLSYIKETNITNN